MVRETFRARVEDLSALFASVEPRDPPLDCVLDVFWQMRGVYMLSEHDGMAALTSSLTVTGNPVVALPCGTHRDGTPSGIQVVGRRHDDARVPRVALALEQALAAHPHCARPVPACFG